MLDALATVSNDIALVAVAGAGHAARVAAQAQAAVTDLVTLGTPLSPVSLTALAVQPTADALRLLHRLLPPVGEEPDDDDLALGRALVRAMMELTPLPDAAADLRPPAVPPVPPRAGLAVCAQFGEVSASQVGQAITAIVAAGLAARARLRAAQPLPPPTGVHAGLRWLLPADGTGTVAVTGSAMLQLFASTSRRPAPTSRACCACSCASATGSAGWRPHPNSNCARSRPTSRCRSMAPRRARRDWCCTTRGCSASRGRRSRSAT